MPRAQARHVRNLLSGVLGKPALAFVAVVILFAGARPADATRLCILPPVLPFAEDDDRRERLEHIVRRSFEGASIEITPSTEVRALLEKVGERSGAIFDPATGRVDAAREEIHRADIESSVRDAFGCDGFIELRLANILAWYDGVSATWDGQSTRVNSGARIATNVFVCVVAGACVSEYGWVPALSLWIRVMDLRRQDIAFRSAGIEPLMDFSLSRDKDLLPKDRWLRDEKKLEEAVASALGPNLSFMKADALPVDASDAKALRWE